MSYLDRYDLAPDPEKFPLVRQWMKAEPLPFFKELREQRPVLVTPACTLLALYDDVIESLLLPAVFTVQLYEDKMAGFLMAQDDTPLHFREKAILQSMLNRDDLPRIREFVGKTAAQLLDEAPGKKLEVVNGLTRRVPIALVENYMGFHGADPVALARWSRWNQWNTFHNQPFDDQAEADEIRKQKAQADVEMRQFLGQLLPSRIAEIKGGAKPDDVLARLLRSSFAEGVGFPMERLARNVGGLLIGTVETTSQSAAQALQQLFRRPAELARAKAAATSDVAAFDGFAFEALRFDPMSAYLFRRCVSDHVIGRSTARETTIKAGTIVLPLIQSASFDPRHEPDPDSFRPDRPRLTTFHFGYGIHECLGRYIGEIMVPEILRQVLLRNNVRPLADIDYKGSPFPEHYEVAWE